MMCHIESSISHSVQGKVSPMGSRDRSERRDVDVSVDHGVNDNRIWKCSFMF